MSLRESRESQNLILLELTNYKNYKLNKFYSNGKKFKSFGLTNLSITNRKTVYLISLIILIGGLIAYQTMPKENFPEIQIPEIYVGIAKPGSSPDYMAEKITQAIEK